MSRLLALIVVFMFAVAASAQDAASAPPRREAPAASPKGFDTGVAAYVNRDVITKAEVWKRLRSAVVGLSEEKRRVAFESKLVEMIEEKIVGQGIERIKLAIPESTVSSLVEEDKESAGGVEAWQKSLSEKGLTAQDWYDQRQTAAAEYVFIQTQTGKLRSLGPALRAEHVIEPTAAEIRKAYQDKLEERFTVKTRVKVRIIVFTTFRHGAGAKDAEESLRNTLAAATGVKNDLATGADFATLAKSHSAVDPNLESFQGWQDEGGTLPKEVASFAFQAEPGTVSDPIRFSRGYYLVSLDAKEAGRVIPFSEAQVAIRQSLKEAAEKRARASVVLRLIRDAYVQPTEYKTALIEIRERELRGR